MSEPRWITFEEQGRPANRVTATWTVRARSQSAFEVGSVEWYARWRQYVFVPIRMLEGEELCATYVFNPECLREIAAFVEAQTREHREARRAKKVEGRTA